MTSDPANGMRSAGVVLLIFGILGGIVSPTGPLWAFIIGCMTVCCIEPGEAGMRKKAPCVRGLSIAGIVLSSLSLIGFIIFGAWLLSAGELACEITRGIYDCPWNRLRRLGQVDGPLLDAKHFTQEIASPGLGRVLSEGYCASGCPEEWKNDGWCDTGCNNAACNFDEGDCDGVPDYDASCPTDCATHMQGNGVCDYQCYSMQCNYDYGDCDSDPMLPDHCDPMHHAVDAVCGWVTGLGAFVIAYPGMLQIIYIIFFSCVLLPPPTPPPCLRCAPPDWPLPPCATPSMRLRVWDSRRANRTSLARQPDCALSHHPSLALALGHRPSLALALTLTLRPSAGSWSAARTSSTTPPSRWTCQASS